MNKISIITTCYNREQTIQDTIESVLSQDYPNIEYIIIDGASTDNTLSIINKYKYKIKEIISEPDSGMYEAINKGIRLATGDIIGLIHSDDIFYSNNTLSHIIDRFNKSNADLIYGNGLFVKFDNPQKIVRNWISGEYNQKKVQRGWLPLHPTVYLKKETIKEIGLYNEKFKIAADTDFLIRCLLKTKLKIEYIDEYIVKMRMGGLSTTPNKIKEKWKEDIEIFKNNGLPPYTTLIYKILSKVPQFF